jgi:hypothetical protein
MKTVSIPANVHLPKVEVEIDPLDVLKELEEEFLDKYGWIEKKGKKYFLMYPELSFDEKSYQVRQVSTNEVKFIDAIHTMQTFLQEKNKKSKSKPKS